MKEIKLTPEDIAAMPPAEFKTLLMQAIKVEGTAEVRRADGSIKYDDEETDDGAGL